MRVNGAAIARYNATAPDRLDETAIKWDGEWQVTIEVFRDLGLAFAAVLVLIYVLVVGWFQSFKIPLVIMAPIPLTLIGILPGHALTGAFFTATSMIGMIALAGIIVRNSILLVDFIQLAEARGPPAARGGARGGRGAVPADRAHGRGRGHRRAGDGARSDLPGPRGGADERRHRGHPAHHGRGAAALLGTAAPGRSDDMKMLVLTYSGADPARVSALLDEAGVPGHTCLEGGRGHGLTGPAPGTRAWPGEVTVCFSVVDDAAGGDRRDALPRRGTSPGRAAARGRAAGRLVLLGLEVR